MITMNNILLHPYFKYSIILNYLDNLSYLLYLMKVYDMGRD